MGALAHVVGKPFGYFFATTDVALVSIRKVAAQQREGQAMPAELVAGRSQLRFRPFHPERPEQLHAGFRGKVVQVAPQG